MLQADGMTDTFQPDVSIDARPGAAPYALVNALRTTAILGAMSMSTDGTVIARGVASRAVLAIAGIVIKLQQKRHRS
jgi:hypothetical protein